MHWKSEKRDCQWSGSINDRILLLIVINDFVFTKEKIIFIFFKKSFQYSIKDFAN